MHTKTILITIAIIALYAALAVAIVTPATASDSRVAAVRVDYRPAGLHREVTVFWPGAGTLEREVHNKVNRTRRERRLGSTVWNNTLQQVTRLHSKDMGDNEYFDHVNLNGESPLDRAWGGWEQTGCKEAIGENLAIIWAEKRAEHQVTDQETGTVYTINVLDHSDIVDTAIELWLLSDSHRENMLDGSWTTTGVGVSVGRAKGNQYPILITQNFCK
ncbi:MAG: CAP domain-containing protein [Candidatus Kaiserbacteria bacterium]|nr:CAP domain-containing protein [Candidatus Kaiserbacteria bacterium]